MEVVEDVDIFINYKPVFAKNIDDKSKKGTFLLETGEKNKEFELDLTVDDLSNLSIFESSKMILSSRTPFQTKYDLYFNDLDCSWRRCC